MRSVWPGSFGGYRGILEHGYYGGREVFLRVASGKYQVGIYQSKTNSMAEAAVASEDIGAVHIVGTYDGSSWNLYKNGELISSAPSTVGTLPVNCDWLIGGSQATNRCFKGEIRDAGIWNVAMTPDEVSTHYAQGFSQSVTSSATYAANGNILTQTDAMGNTTSYTYDTMGRVLTVTDALNNVTSYTYDALGRLLTTTDDVLWSLTDHLGTVRDILGATSTHLIYDAFGNLSGTNPLLFGYTGKAFDIDTQLQNNINRWYDSTVGRWLSTDPIGFEGDYTNLYRFLVNSTLQYIDYDGREFIPAVTDGFEDIDILSRWTVVGVEVEFPDVLSTQVALPFSNRRCSEIVYTFTDITQTAVSKATTGSWINNILNRPNLDDLYNTVRRMKKLQRVEYTLSEYCSSTKCCSNTIKILGGRADIDYKVRLFVKGDAREAQLIYQITISYTATLRYEGYYGECK